MYRYWICFKFENGDAYIVDYSERVLKNCFT